MDCIKASGLANRLGERLFPNARAMIRHYEKRILNVPNENSDETKAKSGRQSPNLRG